MDTDSLIAEFRRLQTGDSRQDFINALVGELTPYEWRATQRALNVRTFQYDIIGRLPVELVAQIFSHLDTSTPYRLQRVSRQWQHILRSPDVLKKGLLSWYGNSSGLHGADHSTYESKAKQAHAFRHGEPTQRFKIELQYCIDQVTLVDDTLIWAYQSADNVARVIYLLNIKTWSVQSLNGDARERVVRLFASTQLVGFVAVSGICYVWRRRDLEKRKFRTPGRGSFESITCRGSTVAYAGRLKENALVYIWDYDTQKGRSFSISYDCPLFANLTPSCSHLSWISLLLQPESENIIVFLDEKCPLDSYELHHVREPKACTRMLRYARFTFQGLCVANAKLSLEDIRPPTMTASPLDQMIPVDCEGRFRMNVDPKGRFEFDEKTFAFVVMLPIKYRDNRSVHMYLHWWKDVFFATNLDLGAGEHSHLTHLGTGDRLHIKNIDVPKCNANAHPVDLMDYMDTDSILLNDQFVVRTLECGFEIMCFGEELQKLGRSGSFFDIGSYEAVADTAV